MKRRSRHQQTAVEMQMGPMIDMVFLLLIFFMVSAKMNQDQNVKLNVPVASHSKVPKEPKDRLTISIKEDGTVYLGAAEVEMDALADSIEQAQKEIGEGMKAFIRGDDAVKHEDIRKIMRACAEKGINDIIFATYTE